MKMYDCDVCMSAGSVNRWGYCEICGEDFEDPGSPVAWHGLPLERAESSMETGITTNATVGELAAVGRDAA
jgi:hypothetical protein